jgi:hypothetical protein
MRFAIVALAVAFLLALGASATPTTSNVLPPKNVPAVTPPVPGDPDQGGDTIATARPILWLPYDDTGTTFGYVDDYDEVCPYTGSLSPDVVYKYSSPANMIVDIYTCNSLYDTKLYVYDNAYTPGAPYACNDDSDLCWGPIYRSYIQSLQLVVGHTYYIVVDGYGGESGPYEFHVMLWGPVCSPTDCPAYAMQEGEPICYDDYVDSWNGGCNSTPNVFQNIALPETICGTSGVYAFGTSTHRDTDWLQFTLSVAKTVSSSVCAEFPPIVGYVDMSLGCPVTAFYAYTTGAAYNPVTLTCALPAGTWVAFVAPADWGAYPCGVNYVATLWEEGTTPVEEKSWGTVKALYR